MYSPRSQLATSLPTAARGNGHALMSLQVLIETVDSFQGKQMDVIIMSCVRASEAGAQTGIGFVSDIRRMNVAITRAKRALWILGSAATLKVFASHDIFLMHVGQSICVSLMLVWQHAALPCLCSKGFTHASTWRHWLM